MASVLAIVSKAVFEKMAPKSVKVGDKLAIDRYTSKHAAFEQIYPDGGAIFMVTVRPPTERLWLVGVLWDPEKRAGAWFADNSDPIVDITDLIPRLELATGTGIKAKKGALGMSLQTPRILTMKDRALLVARINETLSGKKPKATPQGKAYASAVEATPLFAASNKANARVAKGVKKGTGLAFERYRRPFESVAALSKSEKTQLLSLVKNSPDSGGTLEAAAGNDEWNTMELVDIVDVATKIVKFQLYLWPYGSGAMFTAGTTECPANVIQHHFDFVDDDDRDLRAQLAAAYHAAKKTMKIQESVTFQLG